MQQQFLTATPEEYLMKFKTPHEVISSQCHNDVELEMAWDNDIKTILEVYFFFLNIQPIKEQKLFVEDEILLNERKKLVEELRQIVLKWISEESNLSTFKGELLVLGSFRMEVCGKDSDIDTCIVAPACISREEHFFGNFFQRLKQNQHVKRIYQITQTQVPLIKFEYRGVFIDMMFASIESASEPLTASIPCDDKSLWSLNGIQVADYFYNKYHDDIVFKIALKSVKQWAINNGIYRSVLGYLSGSVTCAIMVGKIHQLYPYYSTSQLLFKFFFIYNQWRWEHIPVILEKEPEQFGKSAISKEQEIQGNSLMAILTPIYPPVNSTRNVTQATLKIIQQQFFRAAKIIVELRNSSKVWREVFQPMNFFDLYHQYLEIRILSKEEEELIPWQGYIETRLKKLSRILEDPRQQQYFDVHLYPFSFSRNRDDKDTNITVQQYRFGEAYYYGIKPTKQIASNFDLRSVLRYFVENLEGIYPYLIIPESLNLQIQMFEQNTIPQNVLEQLKHDNFFSQQKY